ncbi:hypothetical protein ISS99_12755 [Dyella mobilis]|uniref:Uncharacterized protein n=2 Tax=Dyella mobilis TaxID=1849582 RepID=A0ABS2KGW4_9GAMM|nr:hypothetical protein [Dyella mobilis]
MGCATLLWIISGASWGQDAWSGNLAVASQYVSRGFQQSWGKPAWQAGLEFEMPHGWYAGSWLSTISPYAIEGGYVEMDLYAGKRGNIGDVGYHATLYGYVYPGARVAVAKTRYNYSEFVVGADWKNWSLVYSLTVSRDYFGDNSQTLGVGTRSHSRGSGYLELARRLELGKGFSLTVHYGRQRINHFAEYNWQDAGATLSRNIAGFDVAIAYGRARNAHGVYRRVTTGVPDENGHLHFSDPGSGTWYFTMGHSF